MSRRLFTQRSLKNPDELADAGLEFKPHRKKAITQIARVEGQFTCMTSNGPVQCDNGYVAIDRDGYPYPISVKAFDEAYVEINSEAEAEANREAISAVSRTSGRRGTASRTAGRRQATSSSAEAEE